MEASHFEGIDSIAADLRAARERWRREQGRDESAGHELPSRDALAAVVRDLRGALFPMRLGPSGLRPENEEAYVLETLASALARLQAEVVRELRCAARRSGAGFEGIEGRARNIVRRFGEGLGEIRTLLDSDVVAAYRGDPAAHNVDEVLLSYPGIQAMIHHRIAHRLYDLGVPVLARLVAEIAHGETGIDIHPGAQIGAGFFIDHGTGVVIGETAVIGRNVRLYQAVTLGAKRFETDENGQIRRGGARHPIIEDDVVIYAGATILGRITIGRGSSIGGNVWLTHAVPPHSHVTQAHAHESPFVEGAGI